MLILSHLIRSVKISFIYSEGLLLSVGPTFGLYVRLGFIKSSRISQK